jgi:hypothetical protein
MRFMAVAMSSRAAARASRLAAARHPGPQYLASLLGTPRGVRGIGAPQRAQEARGEAGRCPRSAGVGVPCGAGPWLTGGPSGGALGTLGGHGRG